MNVPRRLPEKRFRAARGAPRPCRFSVSIEVVTQILGGGSRARELDELDVIRAPAIRGHLRFWWRALHGQKHATSSDLHAAESQLWGRAAGVDGHGRSSIELAVQVSHKGVPDPSDIDPQHTEGAYALWPARGKRQGGRITQSPLPRRAPGSRFQLRVTCPCDREGEVRNTVRAWVLFGGYGGRTRRGLGSLSVVEDREVWLPKVLTREALRELFGRDVFALSQRRAGDTPWLAGAEVHVGQPTNEATEAWTSALDWLRDFRQGTRGPEGQRAREPGYGNRPGRSKWPEADKIRHLTRRTRGHEPRHNGVPVWPRAGFGLPIVGRFQRQARNGGRLDEPDDFLLLWRRGRENEDRLASPLIVKAVPLAGGTFVPCALWLNRAYPAGSGVEVYVKGVEGSGALFDKLVAPKDTSRFAPLIGKSSLRQAFFDWLRQAQRTTVIAP